MRDNFALFYSFGKVDSICFYIFESFGSGQLLRTSLTCTMGLSYQNLKTFVVVCCSNLGSQFIFCIF